jgi:hypothetical protein
MLLHPEVPVVAHPLDWDLKDRKENQDLVSTLKDHQDLLETLVRTDFVVTTAHPETLVSRETLVHLDVTVFLVRRVSLDHPDDTS